MKNAAIITAAGSGSRMEISTNKVLLPFQNTTVIKAAVHPFENPVNFQLIIITYSPINKEALKTALKDIAVPILFVEGGSTRQDSVLKGLEALEAEAPDNVLIHDAARPWLTEDLVAAVLEQTDKKGSSVPVIPSVNAMKILDNNGLIKEHLTREFTVSAQTPQGFHYKSILKAHRSALKDNYQAIDDTEIWDRYEGPVSTVPGDPNNRKITYRKDL